MNGLAETLVLSDEAILDALAIERRSVSDVNALAAERRRLRHALTRQLLAGALTEGEYQKELFHFRPYVTGAEKRLDAIACDLRRSTIKPDLGRARKAVKWLADNWDRLDIAERAEALRLLVSKVTYTTSGCTLVSDVRIVRAGRTFIEPNTGLHMMWDNGSECREGDSSNALRSDGRLTSGPLIAVELT
jgi:hypothetical protein